MDYHSLLAAAFNLHNAFFNYALLVFWQSLLPISHSNYFLHLTPLHYSFDWPSFAVSHPLLLCKSSISLKLPYSFSFLTHQVLNTSNFSQTLPPCADFDHSSPYPAFSFSFFSQLPCLHSLFFNTSVDRYITICGCSAVSQPMSPVPLIVILLIPQPATLSAAICSSAPSFPIDSQNQMFPISYLLPRLPIPHASSSPCIILLVFEQDCLGCFSRISFLSFRFIFSLPYFLCTHKSLLFCVFSSFHFRWHCMIAFH